MESNLMDKLTTNLYKTLKLLYICQFPMENGGNFITLTQIEIAEHMKLSKITVNLIFKELRKEKLIKKISNSGRYSLTPKAIKIVEYLRPLDDRLSK